MSKNNKDFFEVKRQWSYIKDKLLDDYLSLYFSKVLQTKLPIVYIDCFSGPGKFKDGNDGSPLIALKRREEALQKTTNKNPKIYAFFIEPIYYEELNKLIKELNLSDKYGEIKVIKGTFEDSLSIILNRFNDVHVFLYIDPFGIKSLDFSRLISICRKFKGRVELLLNFNTFGFIREACRVAGQSTNEEPKELNERDFDDEITPQSEITLNEIAGGSYWKDIIDEYKKNPSSDSILIAEKIFSKEYKKRLSISTGGAFQYVLDIPIKYQGHRMPKYRMIYATNHTDGCIEMADNMIKRANDLDIENSGGQISFLPVDVNQNIQKDKQLLKHEIKCFATEYLKKGPLHLNRFLSDFLCEKGIICSSAEIRDILKDFEKDGTIKVLRDPPSTITGKNSTFWYERSDKKIILTL